MKRFTLLSILLCLASYLTAQPIKALIVTGQNNHHWELSHQVLKSILENTQRFSVDLAISPPKGGDMSAFKPNFSAYQLVILDYNGDTWSDKTKADFEKYAETGGIVIYHAADNAFPDWKAYNEINALGGWEGRDERSGPWVYYQNDTLVRNYAAGNGGSHGQQHAYFLNARSTSHPVVKGLPTRWLHAKDELYDRMRGPGNIKEVLYSAYSDPATNGSGREEPLIFTVDYKNARIFHTMLGHAGPSINDNPAMESVVFQTTFLRGCEWAAGLD